jgi:DNA sulfur modification protein DndD
MRIDKLMLCDFRQFNGENAVDLLTANEKNVILIGGKNGYGKTTLLMSLVWCLYGEDIAKIDEGFKREIQKEGSYSKYLRSSLNWDKLSAGGSDFYVEIVINDVELPSLSVSMPAQSSSCKIRRSFNVLTNEITLEGSQSIYLETDDDKKGFVNDCLIPVEAAKFVFFDAEKIAEWAELSTREEGNVLNDALGKILGLDIYESLVSDLEVYADGLRKESATSNVKQQIQAVERGIALSNSECEIKSKEIIEKDSSINAYRAKVLEYEKYLSKHASVTKDSGNLEELYLKKSAYEEKVEELEKGFNQLCEIIPFAIMAGNLEQLVEQIQEEDKRIASIDGLNELGQKASLIVEKVFNQSPFPNDDDIPFSKKIFYAEKTRKIIEEIFSEYKELDENGLDLDLSKSQREFVIETFQFISRQSKELFENSIQSFNNAKQALQEINKTIRAVESDQHDEEIIRYTSNKQESQRKLEKAIEERGALQSQVYLIKKTIEADQNRLQAYLNKVEVSEHKRKKLDKANKFISTLRAFVEVQKRNKCSDLEKAIYDEMKKLMHKLQDGGAGFVAAVKAELLPDNDGLQVALLDKEGIVRNKETMSQGEKQIYISSLIKAILSLSVQEYPIFIDTPLGRLDHEHINNILTNYYPDLAGQVVLMVTNNEIPPARFKLMERIVAKTYLIENYNNNSKFIDGYFKGYEN